MKNDRLKAICASIFKAPARSAPEYERIGFERMQRGDVAYPFVCSPRCLFKTLGEHPDARELAVLAQLLMAQGSGKAPADKAVDEFAGILLEDVKHMPVSLGIGPQDAAGILAHGLDSVIVVRVVAEELASGLFLIRYPDGTSEAATGKDDALPKVRARLKDWTKKYVKHVNLIVTAKVLPGSTAE